MKMRLSVLFLSHRGEPILLLQVNHPPGQFRQPLVLGMVQHLFQRFFAVGSETIPQRIAYYPPAPIFVGTLAPLSILTEKRSNGLKRFRLQCFTVLPGYARQCLAGANLHDCILVSPWIHTARPHIPALAEN